MIRLATIEDAKSINELGLIVNKNFTNVYNLDEMFKYDYNKIYLYFEDNKPVGLLMVIELYETCEILNIVVLDEYRNKRIGTNLMDFMISNLNDSVEMMTLEVAVNNLNAISLYKKFGFEVISTRKKYYGDTDAYLMGVKYERC